MGVFYTNHCIVRNHSCPPHERAQPECLGVLTGQCLQQGAPLQHGAAPRALSWQPGSPAPAGTRRAPSWAVPELPCLPKGAEPPLWAFLTHPRFCLALLHVAVRTGECPAAQHQGECAEQSPSWAPAVSPGWPSFGGADPALNAPFALSHSYSTCTTAWVFQEKKHTTSHY